MRARLLALFVLLAVVPQLTWAGTYTVTNAKNKGDGSLRWAIAKANSTSGPDHILFSPALSGRTIRPAPDPLKITSSRTTIDGDINGDGAPDVTLDGELSTGTSGLTIWAGWCVINGLAIVRFDRAGIWFPDAAHNCVRNCHLGVDRAGTTAIPNHSWDIVIWSNGGQTIGQPGGPNVFSCGAGSSAGSAGVWIRNGFNNKVQYNYFGLDRAGVTPIASDGHGVLIEDTGNYTHDNTIRKNVFGGMGCGVEIRGGDENVVQGNLFGLAADGTTSARISGTAVQLTQGAQDNLIGGTTAAARNVFGAAGTGVGLSWPDTTGNRIMGNYFGVNAAGTSQRFLTYGVSVSSGAGAQTIGGSTPAAGNYFTGKCKPGHSTFAVHLSGGGSGSVVGSNRIGVRPDGKNALMMGGGVHVQSASVTVTDNLVARCAAGLDPIGAGTLIQAYRNVFRNCSQAALIRSDAVCRLGNLHNARTNDDGGNDFRTSNNWSICNYGVAKVPAEGNNFHTTVKAEIEARIYDKLDNASYGRVDFIPLAGGIIPTGETGTAALSVTGATALPAPAGAEIGFSLSAPANVTVEVLNLAGRPITTITQERPTAAGLQRMTWSGRTTTGTSAPAGAYLVRIAARAGNGACVNAIAPLHVQR